MNYSVLKFILCFTKSLFGPTCSHFLVKIDKILNWAWENVIFYNEVCILWQCDLHSFSPILLIFKQLLLIVLCHAL